MSTILFQERLEVLIVYIGLTKDEFKNDMRKHYRDINETKNGGNRRGIDRFFSNDENYYPQPKTIKYLTDYLSKRCEAIEADFNPKWLEKTFTDFDKIEELYKLPTHNKSYSSLKFYQNYADEEEKSLKRLIENKGGDNLCRDYLIYRYHSDGKRMVQDVLRVIGYENGTALCDLFLYCDEPDQIFNKYKCNMLIDSNNVFYLISSAPSRYEYKCPYFVLFTFSGDLVHKENFGVVSGLPDEGSNPVSACVLLSSNCKKKLDPKIDVKEIKPDNKQSKTNMFEKFSIYPNPVININNMADINISVFSYQNK